MSRKNCLVSTLFCAAALLIAAKTSRAESIAFTEKYSDVMINVGGLPTLANSDSNYFSASITVPGLHALTSQQWSNLDVEIYFGSATVFADVMSDGVGLTSSSASFPIAGTRTSDGVTVKVGTTTVRRVGDVLTVTSVQNKPATVDASFLLVDNYLGLAGAISDTAEVDIHVGETSSNFSFDTNRTVYVKGSARVGQATDGTELDSVSIAGSADFVPPTIAFISPVNLSRTTNGALTVKVKAVDVHGVDNVQISLNSTNDGDFVSATLSPGTTNVWTTDFLLVPGLNKIRARAVDLDGNRTATIVVSVTFAVIQPLTLGTNGNGRIVGLTNQQPLELMKTYKVTGVPAVSNIFTSWTGDLYSESAAFTFVMQSNLSLTANFMPNPYIPAQGTYQGLFYETGAVGVAHQSSGFFKQTLTSSGTFTAMILSGGASNSFSGKFSAFGLYSNTIARGGGLPPLITHLQMNFGSPNFITGTISNALWSSELTAFRAGRYNATNPSPQAGKYTIVLPGTDNSAVDPGGDGFGTVSVTASGALNLACWPGDNAALAVQSTMVCENAQWPLYLKLYSGKGSMLGWLSFAATDTNDITGDVSWIKLPVTNSVFYPFGFTNQPAAEGSSYTNRMPLLNLATDQVCQVWFTNGNPVANFENDVRFVNNKLINLSSNKLSMTITNSSGIFNGVATNPIDGRRITYKGALLQKRNAGHGQFAGTNQTGRVTFEAKP